MSRNLDIWAIQNNPKKLKIALDNIKTDNDIILFTNLLCNFNIGHQNIKSKSFDTALYSEENRILIMLMAGGKKTADDIRNYLDNKNLDYNEVIFAKQLNDLEEEYKTEEQEKKQDVPEIWFAKDQCILEDAFQDSFNNNTTNDCEYYPFLSGNIDLNYSTELPDKNYYIDKRIFKGVIKMPDKIILLLNNNSQVITIEEVKEITKKYGIKPSILDNTNFNIETKEKNKRKCLKRA